MFANPFGVIAVACTVAYAIGVGFLRDRLVRQSSFSWQIGLLVPGRVLRLYENEHGRDMAITLVRRIRFIAFISFAIGMLAVNFGKIHL
jgi:hypothetical protein